MNVVQQFQWGKKKKEIKVGIGWLFAFSSTSSAQARSISQDLMLYSETDNLELGTLLYTDPALTNEFMQSGYLATTGKWYRYIGGLQTSGNCRSSGGGGSGGSGGNPIEMMPFE